MKNDYEKPNTSTLKKRIPPEPKVPVKLSPEEKLAKSIRTTIDPLVAAVNALVKEIKIQHTYTLNTRREVKKVDVQNFTPIEFPDIQKVELQNFTPVIVEQVNLEFPDEQKVHVENQIEIPEVQKVHIENPQKIEKVVFPKKFEIEKMADFLKAATRFPVGEGDKPGSADPTVYVPVRLTNGKSFYAALEDAWVAAAKSAFPFISFVDGKPTPAAVNPDGSVRVDLVNVETITISGIENVTTLSGSQMDIQNWPTVQTVAVQNMPQQTSVSGTQHAVVDNFPTEQTVHVKSLPALITVSGSATDVKNFPTIQTVQIQNPGTVGRTLVSGTDNVNVANFPTTQTVEVKNIVPVTTASGSLVDVKNFPTNFSVLVQNQIMTQSGSKTDVQNFPTVQTVAVQSLPGVTTVSGSKTDISNFPTYQTVNVQNMPGVTTLSGSQVDVKNFPTFFTANIQNMPNQTSVSGGNFHVFVDNYPTRQTVNVEKMPKSNAAVVTQVAASLTSQTLLTANVDRLGGAFFNNSGATLYLKFGTTAARTDFTVQVTTSGYYELPVPFIYTGRIDGVWDSAIGSVQITELT